MTASERPAPEGPVLVVGGGRAGLRAVRALRARGMEPYLVDRSGVCPARDLVSPERFFHTEAASGLVLARRMQPRWIVPAVPRHLAALWALEHYSSLVPDAGGVYRARGVVPDSVVLHAGPSSGILILSLMPPGQTCVEDCVAPADACALTGVAREFALFDLLHTRLGHLFHSSIVLQSRQLAPGVGGFRWESFRDGLERVPARSGATMAVATASACHGIVNVFRFA